MGLFRSLKRDPQPKLLPDFCLCVPAGFSRAPDSADAGGTAFWWGVQDSDRPVRPRGRRREEHRLRRGDPSHAAGPTAVDRVASVNGRRERCVGPGLKRASAVARNRASTSAFCTRSPPGRAGYRATASHWADFPNRCRTRPSTGCAYPRSAAREHIFIAGVDSSWCQAGCLRAACAPRESAHKRGHQCRTTSAPEWMCPRAPASSNPRT